MINWISIFLVIISGLIFLSSIWYVIKTSKTNNWPSVTGEITTSELDSMHTGTTSFYNAIVEYLFEVDGKQYTNTRIRPRLAKSVRSMVGNITKATRLINRYPNGTKVQVFYDESNPNKSILEPGTNWRHFIIALLVGLVFLDVSMILYGGILLSFSLLLLSMLLIASGLLILVLDISVLVKVRKVKKWPIVEGKVIYQHKRRKRQGRRPVTSYSVTVEYQYEVGGNTYSNDKWKAGGHGTRWGSKKTQVKLAQRYPVGTNVQLHYNPSDPADSVLLTGLDTVIFLIVLIMGFSFFFISFLVFFFTSI
jgi:hypothetical protein